MFGNPPSIRPQPAESAGEPLDLTTARVHEAEGLGRRSFALFQATQCHGPLVWVLAARAPHLPMLRGLADGVGQRLHVIRTSNETDLLWTVEEVLRSPAVGLAIAEPDKPLSLKAGRRLQLAAEAGHTTGLMLIREGQGSNAAETRWHCAPAASPDRDSTLHRWDLMKNKKGTIGLWTVDWHGTTASFHMASQAGERDKPEEARR